MRRVTLLTDFGSRDGYVGAMKGVISSIAPDAALIDLTHETPPQDIHSGAYLLWSMLPYFPADTVHLAVVDPGVGTARRALAARTAWGVLVGPDNGLFSYVWTVAPPDLIVELVNPHYRLSRVSATFHGRDLFAPAAAYLAAGVPLEALGPPLEVPVRLPVPQWSCGATTICGRVLYIDRFGNAITTIGRVAAMEGGWQITPVFEPGGATAVVPRSARVWSVGRDFGLLRSVYGEAAPGEALALVSSDGFLELAVAHGSAAAGLGLQIGTEVCWSWMV